MNQDAPTPAMLTATADVKLALLLALALFQDGDVVRPANFSHKLCEFFIAAIGFIEVLHAPEFCSGKAFGPWKHAVSPKRVILTNGRPSPRCRPRQIPPP